MKTKYDVEVTFPVAPFSVVLGFGLILITEQAVLHFQVLKQFGNCNFWYQVHLKTGAIGGEGAGRAAASHTQHSRVNINYLLLSKRDTVLILNAGVKYKFLE